jgi:hypothetical protein
MLDVLDSHKRLTETDQHRELAEMKVDVNAIKQELEIITFKQ